MSHGTLVHMTQQLEHLVQDKDPFEARYGKRAAVFLEHLPALFRLFHRLTFDFEATAAQRRLAASVAVYVAENQDFFGEAQEKVEGLIDDVWIAFTAVNMLLEDLPEELLRSHWRSSAVFDDMVALARNVDVLSEHVPPRILTLARRFLDLPET